MYELLKKTFRKTEIHSLSTSLLLQDGSVSYYPRYI